MSARAYGHGGYQITLQIELFMQVSSLATPQLADSTLAERMWIGLNL